tara:strand:- start:23 stop:454 length:432 start_codon:yes stop_codon:yes gene_type:complete
MSEILVANNNSPKFREQVEELVGKPFSIWQRLRMKGNGSGRLDVAEYSSKLANCFGEHSGRKQAIIELRPKGIIVYMRNHINDYVWCIPYWRLSIFQSTLYSIHSDGHFIKIDMHKALNVSKVFFQKMLKNKATYTSNQFLPQ